MDEGKIVRVLFNDPADYDARFDTDFEPIKCCVVGWLVERSKKTLRLAWMKDELDDPCSGIAIPQGSIISMHYIISDKGKSRLNGFKRR